MAFGTVRILKMAVANPYQNYEKIKISSSSRENLVIMAYEGAIKFVSASIRELDKGELEKAHTSNLRAQAVICELMKSLNIEIGGEISLNLLKIYEYMNRSLMLGNVQKDKKPLEETKVLLIELLEAWVEVKKNLSVQNRE